LFDELFREIAGSENPEFVLEAQAGADVFEIQPFDLWQGIQGGLQSGFFHKSTRGQNALELRRVDGMT